MNPRQPTLWDQVPEKLLPFKKARTVVWKYRLEYQEEWKLLIEGKLPNKPPLPDNIPPNPEKIYKYTGWKNWKNWLVPPEARKIYSSFNESREFSRCLKLKKKSEWYTYINSEKPLHEKYNLCLPRNPQYEYKDIGWIGWNDWLGNTVDYKSFEVTQKFINGLNLKSIAEWRNYCRTIKSECIYAYPEIAYREKKWKGWDAWLGINLFYEPDKKAPDDLIEGTVACRCRGLDVNCTDCDGKGYYFKDTPTQ